MVLLMNPQQGSTECQKIFFQIRLHSHQNLVLFPSNHFSVATYVGDGTTNNTKTISTECQPDMVWIKSRDSSYGWRVFTPTFKSGNDLKPYYTHIATINDNYSNNDSIQVNSNNFTLGDVADSGSSGDGRGGINQSGQDYVAVYWKLGSTVQLPTQMVQSLQQFLLIQQHKLVMYYIMQQTLLVQLDMD